MPHRLPPNPPPSPARPRTAASPKSLHILLVEDDPDTSRVISRLLRKDGHRVQRAADVASALALSAHCHFELLISDLGLPDASGLDLLRQLRLRHPSLRAIALSGYGQPEDLRSSRDAGFELHLVKPIHLDALQAAIARFSH